MGSIEEAMRAKEDTTLREALERSAFMHEVRARTILRMLPEKTPLMFQSALNSNNRLYHWVDVEGELRVAVNLSAGGSYGDDEISVFEDGSIAWVTGGSNGSREHPRKLRTWIDKSRLTEQLDAEFMAKVFTAMVNMGPFTSEQPIFIVFENWNWMTDPIDPRAEQGLALLGLTWPH